MRPRLQTLLFALSLIPLLLILPTPSAAQSLQMKVTDNGYLDARGVSVMLYDSAFSPVFFDQKDAAMQIILHGNRIATNGSLRLLATPEQWDAIPTIKAHQADKEHDRLTADLSYPEYHLDYHVVVAAEPGGVRVTVNLDQPLPASLVGRAGYNLEFLPSIYMDKAFAVDNKVFGVMPRYPEDKMTTAPPNPDDPKRVWYVEQWHKAEGYTEPLPFASGESVTLAATDPLNRISISSESGPIQMFDGRDKAQNGWFVLRTLIPAGKTKDALVWHIRPNYIPDWTRPTMIAHTQAGYAADFPKTAVLELDPNSAVSGTAKLLRLSDDASLKEALKGRSQRRPAGCATSTPNSIFLPSKIPACTSSSTPASAAISSRSQRTFTKIRGRLRSTAFSPCRWTTYRCRMVITCGTASPISMTLAKPRLTRHTLTATRWAPTPTRPTSRENTFRG